MSVQSSEGAGELLHHLEEKMEVAQVQLAMLEAVQARSDLAGGEQVPGGGNTGSSLVLR
jgi:hypothetical protein